MNPPLKEPALAGIASGTMRDFIHLGFFQGDDQNKTNMGIGFIIGVLSIVLVYASFTIL